MLTQEQVAERVKYIGASEAAAALGLSHWKTPIAIWAEKTGQIPADNTDSLAAWFGTEAEEIVAKRYCMETGRKVHRVNQTLLHPNHNFLACHLDRKVEGERRILQCKTASAFKESAWAGDDIPQEYIIQEIMEMAISGYDTADIACLIGNHRFVIKTLTRDIELENDVIRKLVHFWTQFVEPKVMPTTVKAGDTDTLYRLFPQDDQSEITLTDEANKLCEMYGAMIADKKLLEADIEKTKNELKLMLKDHAVGLTDTYKVTWKSCHKAEYVVKARDERSLRVAKIKQDKKGE